MIKKPLESEYQPYFKKYISLLNNENVMFQFDEVIDKISDLIETLPEEKLNYRYAEGKWSVKQLIGHIADTNTVFAYRALRIARGDKYDFHGYDENQFAGNSNHNDLSPTDLLNYFEASAEICYSLFQTFSNEMMDLTGIVDGEKISVKAIFFVITGHAIHHLNILNERYL